MAKPPKRTGPRPSDVQRRTRELVTPEGVTLHLRLASAGSRAGAFTIDAVIMLATLIALTTRYGQNTGIGYMQEDDNTCVLTPVTITVGEIELGDMNDKKGLEWVILNVTVDDKPLYVVIPSVALVKPTSY